MNKLDLKYFSPLPFDVEDLNIEEITQSYNIEIKGFERTSNGLVIGNDSYNTDHLPDNFMEKISGILESQNNYDNKNQELEKQLENLQQQPSDKILDLMQIFIEDTRKNKLDLGIGVTKTNWVKHQ